MNRSLPDRERGKGHSGPRELCVQRYGKVVQDWLQLGVYIVRVRTSGEGH